MNLKMIGMILLICGEIIVIGSAYQQCNIICDEDHIPSPSLPNVGLPGKAGPQGEAGEKGPQGKTGRNGEKGEAGESCECSSMNDIREEMTGLKKELQRLTSKEIRSTCAEILQDAPSSTDGVYQIQINHQIKSTTINVYCDMTGGGWTVFQKRFDGSENFRRNFNEYSEGFGDPSQEYWMGLNNIHQLTSQPGRWILRVDLETFEGQQVFAQYQDFNVGTGTNYTLSVGSYSGNAGDSMRYNNGQRFSTYDRNQDGGSRDCSNAYNGAWWFGVSCSNSNLNAYVFNDTRYGKGMYWYHFKNSWSIPMKKTTMKMKRA